MNADHQIHEHFQETVHALVKVILQGCPNNICLYLLASNIIVGEKFRQGDISLGVLGLGKVYNFWIGWNIGKFPNSQNQNYQRFFVLLVLVLYMWRCWDLFISFMHFPIYTNKYSKDLKVQLKNKETKETIST